MAKIKKRIAFILTMLLLLSPQLILAVEVEIVEKIKPPDYKDERIIELIKHITEESTKPDDKEEVNVTPEKQKKKPISYPVNTSKPKVIDPEEPISVEIKEPEKLDNKEIIESQENKQFITFKADNGRLYYLVKSTDKDGVEKTELYSEMSDDKLQALSTGKSQAEINRENKLKAEQEELEKQKAKLEALKNIKDESPEKDGNQAWMFLLIIITLIILAIKKLKNIQFDNLNEFEEDELYYEDTSEDSNYEYNEPEYSVDLSDELEFEVDNENENI